MNVLPAGIFSGCKGLSSWIMIFFVFDLFFRRFFFLFLFSLSVSLSRFDGLIFGLGFCPFNRAISSFKSCMSSACCWMISKSSITIGDFSLSEILILMPEIFIYRRYSTSKARSLDLFSYYHIFFEMLQKEIQSRE